MFKKDNKNKKEELNIEKINEGVVLLNKMLKILFIVLIIAAIMIVTYVIKEWRIFSILKGLLSVLSPLFIGIVIAWLFNPLVTKLSKWKLSRFWATILVYTVFIALLVVILVYSVPVITSQINDFIDYVPTLTKNIKDMVNNFLGIFESALGSNSANVKQELYNSIIQIGRDITIGFPDKIVGLVTAIVSGLGSFVIGLFVGLYMLFDFDHVSKVFINLLPKSWREDAKNLMDISNKTLVNYVQGILITITLVFIGNAIGFSIAGLKAALLFALFCGVTNAIPYIGPYIGAIPAAIVGFTQSTTTGIIVIISAIVVQLFDNVLFTPLVQSKGLKLHPVTVIISLLVFGKFFGILGMILAVPIVAVFKTIFTYFNDKYKFINIKFKNETGGKNGNTV